MGDGGQKVEHYILDHRDPTAATSPITFVASARALSPKRLQAYDFDRYM